MASEDDIKPKKANRVHTSMLVWVLMAMLVTGLGGFGLTDFGRSLTAIGTVGTQEIGINDYARALRNQVNALSKQVGQQLSYQQAQIFGVDQQVLAALIANAALDNEATRLGLSVGDAAVATRVASDPNFADITGTFNADTYKLLLDQNNLTVREFESGLRADVARSVLQTAVVGGVVAPDPLVDTLAAYAGETRTFTLLSLTEATLPSPLPAPTDADLTAFYQANIAQFTRAEAKRITYAALTPADLAATITVTDAEVQALYDSRKADYVTPEKRLVERLVFPSQAEADAAKARLDAGTPFETLVADRGLDLTDIDLGDVTKSDLAEAGEPVFALAEPGIVGPVMSNLGPALFRMNAILPAQETTLADVQSALKTELQTKAAATAVAEQSTAIDDALAGGATLDDLVQENGMTLITTDYVAGAGDNDAIAADATFAAAADKLATGDYPEALLLADGSVVALRLDEIVPPAPVPLDKIKDKVATAFRADALATALTAQSTAAEAAVKAGADLATLGTPLAITAIPRDATPEGTTPEVVKTAFAMAPGEVRRLDTDGFTGLIRLDTVTPLDPASAAAKAARDQLAAQGQQSLAQDVYDLYTAAMTAQGVLTIDQTALTSVQAQMN